MCIHVLTLVLFPSKVVLQQYHGGSQSILEQIRGLALLCAFASVGFPCVGRVCV